MIAYHSQNLKGQHQLRGAVGIASLVCTADTLPEVRRKFRKCMDYLDEVPNSEPLIIRMGLPKEVVDDITYRQYRYGNGGLERTGGIDPRHQAAG